MAHASIPGTRRVEVGGFGVQSQSCEIANLRPAWAMRPCLRKQKKKNKKQNRRWRGGMMSLIKF